MTDKTIYIVAYDFKPGLGGVANYGHELAVQFSRRARVHVLCPKQEGMEEFDRGVPYQVTRIRCPHSALLSIPLFARALRRMVRDRSPDGVFCLTWLPDGAAAHLVLRRSRIPYFVAAHGTEVFDNFASVQNRVRTVLTRQLKRDVFAGAAKVFPVSRYTRGALLEESCGTERSIVTINNGVNPEIFARVAVRPEVAARHRPAGERILLTVTRLYPYKGVDRMLEALPAVVHAVPGLRYVVVGAGPDRARLEGLASSLGVRAHVEFLGPRPLAEIVELYSLADLFVMLSRDEPPDVEGFGLVFLEAAACGLPSLGGRSGGIPDAIEEGKSGWLVNPTDTREITDTVIGLLTSPDRLARASAFCLATAPQKSWERVADGIWAEMFGRQPE